MDILIHLAGTLRLQAVPALFLAGLVFLSLSTPAYAQTDADEEEAILDAVQQLFDAIAARDTLAARAVLLPKGGFFSIRDTEGGPRVGTSTHREFLDQLTTPGDDWQLHVCLADRSVLGTLAADAQRGQWDFTELPDGVEMLETVGIERQIR